MPMRPTKVIIYLIIPDQRDLCMAVGWGWGAGCWNRSFPKATRVECPRAALKVNGAFPDKDQKESSVLLLLLSHFGHVRLCATP